MKVLVKVQNAERDAGYIEVIPQSKIYSKDLKDYLGSVLLSPDADFSIFPRDLIEELVFKGEPFMCSIPLDKLVDPAKSYIIP